MLGISYMLGSSSEVIRLVGLAAAAFGKLSNIMFNNKNLILATRAKAYKMICLSVILYGCEAWVPYR